MKIYTRTGDAGETGLLGAGRVSKSAPRVQAIGALDELNAWLGLVLAESTVPEELRPVLRRVQSDLFEAGAVVAWTGPPQGLEPFDAETAWLEGVIDEAEAKLPKLVRFILPGGARSGALLHCARGASRRAERELVGAVSAESDYQPVLAFLNRLSDALFVLARRANQLASAPEEIWESRASSGSKPA